MPYALQFVGAGVLAGAIGSINIYVGNVPYAATEEDLETLFGEYGPVATATIIRDRYDGRSKGFGFVEMENQEDGERAIEALDGHEMMGQPLKVNPARPRGERRQPRGNVRCSYFNRRNKCQIIDWTPRMAQKHNNIGRESNVLLI